MHGKKRSILAFLAICISLLTAWQTRISAQATPTPIITERPNTLGPTFAANVNPLTGLTVNDAAVLNRRPIIVKISNSPPDVRPQAGLGLADMVYEHYTELGITRFSAIFLTNAPERVGSIRSARLIDYELAPMYQAILAFAGASIGVDKRIYGTEFVVRYLCADRDDQAVCQQEARAIGPVGDIPPSDFVDRAYKGTYYGAPMFFRDETIPAPHNLFANLEVLWAQAERDGNGGKPVIQGMRFNATPPTGEAGSGIYAQIRYLTTTAEWYYDAATNLYYRSTDGERHFDGLTNEQVRADNVLIVYAGHYLTDIIESGGGDNINWSEQITIWTQGKAILLRDGKRYEVIWKRETRPELLTLWTSEGVPVELKPGQTWVQVVRLEEQMDVSNEWVIVQ